MRKYSPNDSLRSDSKPRLPRIKNLNYSNILSTSPTSSSNCSLIQSSFIVAPGSHGIKIPILNTRPVSVQAKARSLERNADDNEYFDEYAKCEILKCRKIGCDRFPFWYLNSVGFADISSYKEEFSLKHVHSEDRGKYNRWLEGMTEKLDLAGVN